MRISKFIMAIAALVTSAVMIQADTIKPILPSDTFVTAREKINTNFYMIAGSTGLYATAAQGVAATNAQYRVSVLETNVNSLTVRYPVITPAVYDTNTVVVTGAITPTNFLGEYSWTPAVLPDYPNTTGYFYRVSGVTTQVVALLPAGIQAALFDLWTSSYIWEGPIVSPGQPWPSAFIGYSYPAIASPGPSTGTAFINYKLVTAGSTNWIDSGTAITNNTGDFATASQGVAATNTQARVSVLETNTATKAQGIAATNALAKVLVLETNVSASTVYYPIVVPDADVVITNLIVTAGTPTPIDPVITGLYTPNGNSTWTGPGGELLTWTTLYGGTYGIFVTYGVNFIQLGFSTNDLTGQYWGYADPVINPYVNMGGAGSTGYVVVAEQVITNYPTHTNWVHVGSSVTNNTGDFMPAGSGVTNEVDPLFTAWTNSSAMQGISAGAGAWGALNGVAIGPGTDASTDGAAVGVSAIGRGDGAAVGYGAQGNDMGAAVGSSANGSGFGVAAGYQANGSGAGNVAIGWQAIVNTNGGTFDQTVEIGRGTATNNGWFHYRGVALFDPIGNVTSPTGTFTRVNSSGGFWDNGVQLSTNALTNAAAFATAAQGAKADTALQAENLFNAWKNSSPTYEIAAGTNATTMVFGTAIGALASAGGAGSSLGYSAASGNGGVSVGGSSKSDAYGVAVGANSSATGASSVAIGKFADTATLTNTTEIGAGVATNQGWFHYKGVALFDPAGNLTAPTGTFTVVTAVTGNVSVVAIGDSQLTTNANGFISNTNFSPSVDAAFDLGDDTHQWRHLKLSGSSIYMNGVKVMSYTNSQLVIAVGVSNVVTTTQTMYAANIENNATSGIQVVNYQTATNLIATLAPLTPQSPLTNNINMAGYSLTNGSFVGNGSGLTNVNAVQLAGIAAAQYVTNGMTFTGSVIAADSYTGKGASAASFTGNGAGLTNIPASGVVGVITSVVAGANISTATNGGTITVTGTSAALDTAGTNYFRNASNLTNIQKWASVTNADYASVANLASNVTSALSNTFQNAAGLTGTMSGVSIITNLNTVYASNVVVSGVTISNVIQASNTAMSNGIPVFMSSTNVTVTNGLTLVRLGMTGNIDLGGNSLTNGTNITLTGTLEASAFGPNATNAIRSAQSPGDASVTSTNYFRNAANLTNIQKWASVTNADTAGILTGAQSNTLSTALQPAATNGMVTNGASPTFYTLAFTNLSTAGTNAVRAAQTASGDVYLAGTNVFTAPTNTFNGMLVTGGVTIASAGVSQTNRIIGSVIWSNNTGVVGQINPTFASVNVTGSYQLNGTNLTPQAIGNAAMSNGILVAYGTNVFGWTNSLTTAGIVQTDASVSNSFAAGTNVFTGRVGLGTNLPGVPLEIFSSGVPAKFNRSGDGSALTCLNMVNTGSNVATGARLNFAANTSTSTNFNCAYITSYITTAPGAFATSAVSDLIFYTKPIGAPEPIESMRLTGAGVISGNGSGLTNLQMNGYGVTGQSNCLQVGWPGSTNQFGTTGYGITPIVANPAWTNMISITNAGFAVGAKRLYIQARVSNGTEVGKGIYFSYTNTGLTGTYFPVTAPVAGLVAYGTATMPLNSSGMLYYYCNTNTSVGFSVNCADY